MSGRLTNKRVANGVKYILYPVSFFLAGALLLVAALGPVVTPYLGMLDLAFLDEAPSFDREAGKLFNGAVDQADGSPHIAADTVALPADGDEFGRLLISSAGIDAPLMYGDSPKELRKGVGLFTGTYLPGQGRTILGGAHNNSYFRNLRKVKIGDRVDIQTNYGTYVYEVTGSKGARFDDTGAYDLTKREENLILYTCDNTLAVGATPYRLFVYAKYVSGPVLVS